MASFGKFQPAKSWRAFFAVFAVALPLMAAPPPSSPPALAQVGKPNAEESAKILDQFRQSGWHGYVEFELHALPRRGDETVFHGKLWGGQNERGAITRIEVTDAQGAVTRFLLQNGATPAVWRSQHGAIAQVDRAASFRPLIEGVEITPFDLQMPFLYWPDARVESVTRIRGRPAYVFVFTPPPGASAGGPGLKLVRAYFDAQFNAPVQIEQVGAQHVLKTMSLVDLKKVGDQWIPRSFDLRNDVSRDKTRFLVTAVALGLDFPPAVFAPSGLNDAVAPPPPARVVSIER